MISLLLASLGRIKKRSSLLHLAGEGIGPPVGEAGLLRNLMMMMVMTMIMVMMVMTMIMMMMVMTMIMVMMVMMMMAFSAP